jgi:hypothetical protein
MANLRKTETLQNTMNLINNIKMKKWQIMYQCRLVKEYCLSRTCGTQTDSHPELELKK